MKIRSSAPAFSAIAALKLASAASGAESADELIKKGDVFYDRLQPSEALKYYLPAEKLQPNNARLLVRIARQYRHLMSDASMREDKLKLGEIALGYARRAVLLAPKDSEAQLALAISLGKLLPLESNKERVEASRQIKCAAERVIELDPRNDLGWHVLGRWNLNLAEVSAVTRALAQVVYGKLPNATYDDAAKCFEKAIELNPNRLMHYIELGRTLAQMDRADEARKYLTKGLAMAETEKDDPETKARGREILAKLR